MKVITKSNLFQTIWKAHTNKTLRFSNEHLKQRSFNFETKVGWKCHIRVYLLSVAAVKQAKHAGNRKGYLVIFCAATS